MNRSKYDELIEKLINKCRLEGPQENSITMSSKLLEIDFATRSIDQQLDCCKYLIIDTLKSYESRIIEIDDLTRKREETGSNLDEKLCESETIARMNEIAKIRDNFFVKMKENEILNRRCDENCDKLEDLRRQLILERDNCFEEISSVQKSIQILENQLRDTVDRTKFLKTENSNFRDSLVAEEKSLRRRGDEARENLKKLVDRK